MRRVVAAREASEMSSETTPATDRLSESRGQLFESHAADLTEPRQFGWLAEGLVYGGDYNPEQWPAEVWADDVRLMQQAGVTTVSLGIFSWGLLETADGVYDFDWLDRVLDLLHEHGITVALATPTASPPIWLYQQHPEILTVDERGVRRGQGARLGWCPSSPVFRTRALSIVRAVAERYATHPALRIWHVGNEIGNENARCFCDQTAAAFSRWLQDRYLTVDTLNGAWGTAFWGHRYGVFAEVQPPRAHGHAHNPGLLLDFERFSSDTLLGHYQAERDLLRTITPDIPVTTNFMVNRDGTAVDYARWAEEVDLVANDHYPTAADPLRHWELAMAADRVRGMSGGRPWLLMENATSAVNWQPRNRAKLPGELTRDALSHVARGADGVMFFQWRQSTAGSEQFHSAMVPHAGTDTKVWREVVALGGMLKHLAELRGSQVEPAQVAILWDYPSIWALRSGAKPSIDLDYLDLPLVLHRSFARRHRQVDLVSPQVDLSAYAVIVVPMLYLAHDGLAPRLQAAAEGGAQVLITYFSGIADATNRVITGGYPGAYRELLGAVVEEFHPLLADEQVELDSGWRGGLWSEQLHVTDAEVVASYVSGPVAGQPAVTRRALGTGAVTYLSTRPRDEDLQALVDDLLAASGVGPVAAAPDGVDVVRRVDGRRSYLFAINHTASPAEISSAGRDLLTGDDHAGTVTVPAGGVVVIRER
ncbi:MAG: beta-galactosidase [Propionibacteriaceae bacterium]